MERKLKWLTEEQWLAMRKDYLTATAVPSVLGINPYTSPAKAVKEKNNSTFTGNAYSLMGELLEEVNIRLVNHCLGCSYKGLTKVNFKGDKKVLFSSIPELRLAATPDAQDDNSLLECKSTQPKNCTKWLFNPPLYYVMQLHVQLFCMDKPEGKLSILGTDLSQTSPTLNVPLSVFKVSRSSEIDDLCIWAAKTFWQAYDNNETLKVNPINKAKATSLIMASYEKVY